MGGAGMKRGWREFISVMAAACLLMGILPVTALAATKSITSVTVRVGTDTELGETLPSNIATYDDSTETHSGTYAGTNSTKYYVRDAEWVTSTTEYMKVGQEPRMRLYLYILDDDYAFRSTYSANNVNVKGGTFVSAKRSSRELEIVVKLNGIKGKYPVPSEASWRDSGSGRATWNVEVEEDEDSYSKAITSGYYDVYLYRGKSLVTKLEGYKGTTYNFYPYMTKAGTYTFKVRTVPYTEAEKACGTKSDWLESDEFYIDAQHVSDGSGQTVEVPNTEHVGWILEGNTWFYKYPDGSLQKDSWLMVSGLWYLFDTSGRMLTGWQAKDGLTYYLYDSGAMHSGWLKAGDYWYYFNTIHDDGIEGAMRTGWLVLNGKTYYLKPDGAMAEGWYEVDRNWYYFYPGDGSKAVNTVIETFYVDANGIWTR